MLAATGMGVASSAYWIFSSDVLISLGHCDQAMANLVWIMIGVAGLAGVMAGYLMGSQGHLFCSIPFSLVSLASALIGYRKTGLTKDTQTDKTREHAEPEQNNARFPTIYMPAMPPIDMIEKLDIRVRKLVGSRFGRR